MYPFGRGVGIKGRGGREPLSVITVRLFGGVSFFKFQFGQGGAYLKWR
jgi:hypothetical protein